MLEKNIALAFTLLPRAFFETLYMILSSGFYALIFGLPLGLILFITGKGQLLEHPKISKILGMVVNIVRSFPFAILLIALIPFTRLIVGTSLGTTASIIPLSIAAIPFVARLFEASFRTVNTSDLEAATMMGSTPIQILYKVLIPEAFPLLIADFTTTVISIVGYTAMAGLVGGGGLGSVAIQYGYQRFNGFIMFWTVASLILLVQIIQWIGTYFSHRLLKKRGLV